MAKTRQETPVATPPPGKASSPPYMPWKALVGFIEHLQKTVTPPRIDSSMMPHGMSGGTRSQLKSTLKFLGFTDDGDHVTDRFRAVIKAYGTAEWGEQLGDTLSQAYERIIATLDLDAGTARQLAEHFRERGHVEGEMLEKCIRFYLQASKSAGWTYSPHFDARGTKTAMRGKRPAKPKGAGAAPDGELPNGDRSDDVAIQSQNDPTKLRRFALAIPGKPDALIQVPHDLTEKEWKMIDGTLRAFVSLNAG
jgi:hypothetical protein